MISSYYSINFKMKIDRKNVRLFLNKNKIINLSNIPYVSLFQSSKLESINTEHFFIFLKAFIHFSDKNFNYLKNLYSILL